jgi:hypothetical protein
VAHRKAGNKGETTAKLRNWVDMVRTEVQDQVAARRALTARKRAVR